jgi:hypothetical protein
VYKVALRDDIREWVLVQGRSQPAAAKHFGISRDTVALLLREPAEGAQLLGRGAAPRDGAPRPAALSRLPTEPRPPRPQCLQSPAARTTGGTGMSAPPARRVEAQAAIIGAYLKQLKLPAIAREHQTLARNADARRCLTPRSGYWDQRHSCRCRNLARRKIAHTLQRRSPRGRATETYHQGGTGRASARSGAAPSSSGAPPGRGGIRTSVTAHATRTAAPQNTSAVTSPCWALTLSSA